ncbi:UNVERIFIED_CONTAM: hypothetical protein HDU68_003862 [Siphonaria sp. JEL0065]|nr:hypothetical protein HDU68_003862 [Siphonaria sp. JEL0065]
MSELFEHNLAHGNLAKGSIETPSLFSLPSSNPDDSYSASLVSLDGDGDNMDDTDTEMGRNKRLRYDSQASVESTNASPKDSTEYQPLFPSRVPATHLGERPNRSHSSKVSGKAQLDLVTKQLSSALEAFSKPQTYDDQLDQALKLPPEGGVKLTMMVAAKLDKLLTAWDGVFNGYECPWLQPKYVYKYRKALGPQEIAAWFMGLKNEEGIVEFLKDIYEEV